MDEATKEDTIEWYKRKTEFRKQRTCATGPMFSPTQIMGRKQALPKMLTAHSTNVESEKVTISSETAKYHSSPTYK